MISDILFLLLENGVMPIVCESSREHEPKYKKDPQPKMVESLRNVEN
jgi:hypothetical protein